MEYPGISFSESDGFVFLRSEPIAARASLDATVLNDLLVQAGFGDCQIDDAAIASAAISCNEQRVPFVVQVAQRLGAEVQVEITEDEMTASVSCTPSQSGAPATVDDVMQALAEAGVVFGIDPAAVRQACDQRSGEPTPVAQGVPPQDGTDTIFEESNPQTVDRAPQLDEDGLIDYREHGSIAVVHSGELLMRRIPASPGIQGQTVRGTILPPRPGHDEPFAAQLQGTELAKEDPNLLQAAITGQPIRVHCGVMVEPVLRVPEVNMASGNIHYDGTVQVDGDVTQGMKIQASGDIVVNGTVDGGLLEAGGNIRVTAGIIAHASLRAGGSVSARFAEGARIFAGTVIALEDMALECELQSLNQIIVGASSPQRGRLTGGTAIAMMLIRTPILGSEKGSVTKVVMGVNPELEAKYQTLQLRIDKEKAAQEALEKLAKQLSSTGDPKGMLERVNASLKHAIQIWGRSLAERNELDQQFALARKARVELSIGVQGAVDLSFGKLTARLRKEFGAGAFFVNSEGHIVSADVSGFAVPVS